MDQGGAFAVLAVCVIRTNFVRTGANAIVVTPGRP